MPGRRMKRKGHAAGRCPGALKRTKASQTLATLERENCDLRLQLERNQRGLQMAFQDAKRREEEAPMGKLIV
jgi:hypothetical protein